VSRATLRARLGRTLAFGGVAVLLLGGTVAGLLFTAPGNRILEGALELGLEQVFPQAQVELDGLRFGWPGTLSWQALRLSDRQGRVLIESGRLALDLNELKLTKRRVGLEALELEGLLLDLRTGSQRMALLETLGLGGGPPSDLPWQGLPGAIFVQQLHIADATLLLDGARLEGLDLRAGLRVDRRSVRLSALQVQGALVEPAALPLSLRGELALDEGELQLGGLLLEAGEGEARSSVSLDGRVEAIETAPVLELDLVIPHLSKELVEALSGRPLLAVDLSGRLHLGGAMDRVEGDLVLDAAAGGKAHGALVADLVQEPAAWGVDLELAPLDLDALLGISDLPASAARLELSLRGSGLSWPDGITAHARARLEEAWLDGNEVEELVLTAQLHQGRIGLLDLWLKHPAGIGRATGSIGLSSQAADLNVDLQLTDLSELSTLARTPLGGRASWTNRVRADWSQGFRMNVEGPLSGTGVQVLGLRMGRLSGPVGLSYDADGLALASDLSFVGLSGRGLSARSGQGELTLGWSSSEGTRLQSELQVSALQAQAAGMRLDDLRGVVSFSSPPEGEASMNGTVTLRGLSRDGMAEGDRLDGELGLVLRGELLDADLRLRDPGEREVLGLVLGVDQGARTQVAVRRFDLEPVEGLRWSGQGVQRLELEDGSLRSAQILISGSAGALRVDQAPGSSKLQASLEDLDLASVGRVGAWLGMQESGVLGRVQADLAVDLGPRGQPLSLDLKASLEDLVLPERIHGLRAELMASGPIDHPQLDLALWGPPTGAPIARASGSLALDGFGLDCRAPMDLRLVVLPGQLDLVRPYLPLLPDLSARGSADLQLSGLACDPQLDLVAAVSGPLGPDGEDVRLDLEASRQADQLTVRAFVEEGFTRRLLVSGGAETGLGTMLSDLRGGREVQADLLTAWVDELAVNVVPLDLSLQEIGRYAAMPTGAYGRLAGGFQILGSPLDPRLSGGLQLIGGGLGDLEIESALLMIVPDEQGYQLTSMLSFPSGIEGVPSRSIQANGQLRERNPDGTIDLGGASVELGVEGTLPLVVLRGLIEGVDAPRGDLDIAAQISGALAAPLINADLSLVDGAFDYDPLGVSYEDVDLSMNIADGRVSLRRLELGSRRQGSSLRLGRNLGTLVAEGHAELEGLSLTDIRAAARLEDFWLFGLPDREVALSGDVDLVGDWPAPRLSGDLTLAASQIRIDETSFLGDRLLELDPALTVVRSGADEGPRVLTEEAPSLLSKIEMDLSLDLLRNLRLRATVPMQQDFGQQLAHLSSVGLDADLGGELRVLQQAGALSLRGELETLRGSATVLGVPFDIEEGTIAFVGDGYDDPLIDIHAVRNTGGYGDVDVSVSGRLSALEIDPSSESYPDKKDVVTLLLFGKPASEMEASQGSAASQIIGATVSALSGQLEQAIGATLFDELRIDPAGAVRVGWSLNSRLFLRLEQRAAALAETGNRTELTLEYLITRRMYAEFVTGDRAASRAHLYWRWRF